MERLVIKVGSNVLTREDRTLDVTRVSALVDQMVLLKEKGYEVILVTSGAVACGRSILGAEDGLDSVEQRQVYSAVGQVRLMDLYNTLFGNYGIRVGQVLTMKDNFTPGKAYENQKGCMEAMLKSGVVPIVNENDTVSITELMFTDNDELSGLIATMMQAESLIILSDVAGLYDGNPSDPRSKVIAKVYPGEDIGGCIQEAKSDAGRGGMQSKSRIAQSVAASGIRVFLACGKTEGILTSIIDDSESVTCTEFVPSK